MELSKKRIQCPERESLREVLNRLHECRQIVIESGPDSYGDEITTEQKTYLETNRVIFIEKHVEQELWSSINELMIIRRGMRIVTPLEDPLATESLNSYKDVVEKIKRESAGKCVDELDLSRVFLFWGRLDIQEVIIDGLGDVTHRLENVWKWAKRVRNLEVAVKCDRELIRCIRKMVSLRNDVRSNRSAFELLRLENDINIFGGMSVNQRL